MQWYAREQGEFLAILPASIPSRYNFKGYKLPVIFKSHRDESFALDADFFMAFLHVNQCMIQS